MRFIGKETLLFGAIFNNVQQGVCIKLEEKDSGKLVFLRMSLCIYTC